MVPTPKGSGIPAIGGDHAPLGHDETRRGGRSSAQLLFLRTLCERSAAHVHSLSPLPRPAPSGLVPIRQRRTGIPASRDHAPLGKDETRRADEVVPPASRCGAGRDMVPPARKGGLASRLCRDHAPLGKDETRRAEGVMRSCSSSRRSVKGAPPPHFPQTSFWGKLARFLQEIRHFPFGFVFRDRFFHSILWTTVGFWKGHCGKLHYPPLFCSPKKP